MLRHWFVSKGNERSLFFYGIMVAFPTSGYDENDNFCGASKKIKFYIFKLKQMKYREPLKCENAMRLEQYSRALTLSGAKIVCELPCNLLAQTAFL